MTEPTGRIIQGDSLVVLRTLPAESIHAVVTDPPYGLHFMGKTWDQFGAGKNGNKKDRGGYKDGRERPHLGAGTYDPRRNAEYGRFMQAVGRELFRVLKPGGHLLMFGAPRRHHWQGVALELAGFEVRDTVCWLFGQGFPKGLNVERALAEATCPLPGRHFWWDYTLERAQAEDAKHGRAPRPDDHVCPTTSESAPYDGYNVALKPGWEPIIVARKPFRGTVAANVLEHGTGAINVGAARLEGGKRHPGNYVDRRSDCEVYGTYADSDRSAFDSTIGRWPANVAHDGSDEVLAAFEAFGERPGAVSNGRTGVRNVTYGPLGGMPQRPGPGDTGSAARFFYCGKAGRTEREAGLEGFERKALNWSSGEQSPGTFQSEGTERNVRNNHPTVKPVALMRWLVRLVTPPGGVVLDPFAGSGTTGCACMVEGVGFVGVEKEPDYVRIAEARLAHWRDVEGPRIRAEEAAARGEGAPPEVAQAERAGQTSLLEVAE